MAGSGDPEYARCVPIYTDKLANLSDHVGTLLEVRWARREEEHEWETEAVAEHPDDDDDGGGADAAERQLALACQLSSHTGSTEYMFDSVLRIIGDELRHAVAVDADHRRRRPHPGTAAWWHQRGRGGLRHTRFVQVSREEVARAQELVADASKRTQRLRALAEDLDRDCCWPPSEAAAANAAVLHSTPRLLERLRRAQRLADAILIPLHPLKRLLDRLIGANEPRRRGKRGRRRSATPSRAADADPLPMIRRRSI